MKNRVKDPVCEMEFAAESAAAVVAYQERTYHFCTEACRRQFEQNPGRYVKRGTREGRGPRV